ncbi:MAG: amidase [Betaproteobacteria bacterium]|nr:amidase [Betaproteobacteria bacterium]
MTGLNSLGALDAARKIARREIRSEDLVRACLERIRERDAEVGAWVSLDAEGALQAARECDRNTVGGPLHGVPIGVKDIIDTANLPTEFNSPIYRGHQPRTDASCVAIAKNAGAIVLGKTVTTEFAFTHPGKTRNPHHLAYSPGGSSSGSAAAVADRMVPLTIGTQTGGSVIRPGAFCGVVAIKPSFNTINRAGVKSQSESLDTVGVFGRSIEDAGLFLHALSGVPAPDFTPLQFLTPTIGICRTPHWDRADKAMQDRLEEVVTALARAGAVISNYALDRSFEHVYADQEVTQMYEAVRAFACEYSVHRSLVSGTLLARLDAAVHHTRERYNIAQQRAAGYRARIAADFDAFDALLTISAPGEAPHGIATTGNAEFNRIWTLFGTPCVNVPAGVGPNGLPLGVQVVGPYGADNRTMMIAEWVRRTLDV